MFKIEKTLLLNQNTNDLTFKAVIKEFLKEANMLISNIHLTHIYLQREIKNSAFPLETNKYDGAWYKNLFVAAEIIIDRLHSRIEENKDYLKVFNDVNECDFVAFAKKWNKINFMVKYNTSNEEWNQLCKTYNIFTTSRKLEELIAKNIGINLDLLKSLSLDLNQYRSIAKKLDDEHRNDYDSLIANLVPEVIQSQSNNAINNNQQANQLQPQLQPQLSNELSIKKEKGPLSPLAKELAQLLKWAQLRESEIRAFKAKQSKGYDLEEYKKIVDQFEKVQQELKLVNDELANTKIKAPLDPLAKELAQIERWSKEQETAIKKFAKLKGKDADKEQYNQIEKCLDKVQIELTNIDAELANTKIKAPLDPLAKELNQILSWIKSRQSDITAYKRMQKQQSINDELKLIEKELKIVHEKSQDISTTIDFIHKNRPIDPYKKELDQLIRWISAKEQEIRKIKNETLKKEKLMKLALIDNLRQEIKNVDNEIHYAQSFMNSEPSLEQNMINSSILDNENIISRKEMLAKLRAEVNEIEKEIEFNKNIVNKQILLDTKEKSITNESSKEKNYEIEIINNLTDEQLYDLAEIYDIEAAILKTAIEVMPKQYQKYGFDALPKMLQHLIESGYIEIKENYTLVEPTNQYKLRQAQKVVK